MTTTIKKGLKLMQPNLEKKTRHEGDEGTVEFWVYMKALYKDEEWKQQQYIQALDVHGVIGSKYYSWKMIMKLKKSP